MGLDCFHYKTFNVKVREFTIKILSGINRIQHRSPMQTETSQREGKQIML